MQCPHPLKWPNSRIYHTFCPFGEVRGTLWILPFHYVRCDEVIVSLSFRDGNRAILGQWESWSRVMLTHHPGYRRTALLVHEFKILVINMLLPSIIRFIMLPRKLKSTGSGFLMHRRACVTFGLCNNMAELINVFAVVCFMPFHLTAILARCATEHWLSFLTHVCVLFYIWNVI